MSTIKNVLVGSAAVFVWSLVFFFPDQQALREAVTIALFYGGLMLAWKINRLTMDSFAVNLLLLGSISILLATFPLAHQAGHWQPDVYYRMIPMVLGAFAGDRLANEVKHKIEKVRAADSAQLAFRKGGV